MDDEINREAVGRVIEAMRENLGEQLTVDRMARMALFSKFHFTRVFRRVTGISPGRFRSALRLQRAKELLISTSMSVSEISHEVGYTSVGTFSTRFSSSVGIPPTTYRRLAGRAPELPELAGDVLRAEPETATTAMATMQGTISAPSAGAVFVGVFRDPVPRGRPARCTTLPGPGRYSLDGVPPGTWFLFGHLAGPRPHRRTCHRSGPAGGAASLGTCGPIRVRAHMVVEADLALRPMSPFDPPVLLAMLDGGSRHRPG